ncbi:hypothetical protein L596_003518 [Steinernema carpocapsae]|uniref:Uncharacterized protein n=1 Tax=Steinernema carpocapsae TaxID=34508 RepID=A0A4U8UVZ9_STECR|nr:hypothetical protein L596_003518 [Steinernema carpocapsae]
MCARCYMESAQEKHSKSHLHLHNLCGKWAASSGLVAKNTNRTLLCFVRDKIFTLTGPSDAEHRVVQEEILVPTRKRLVYKDTRQFVSRAGKQATPFVLSGWLASLGNRPPSLTIPKFIISDVKDKFAVKALNHVAHKYHSFLNLFIVFREKNGVYGPSCRHSAKHVSL